MQQCQTVCTQQQKQTLSLSPDQIRDRIVPRLLSTVHHATKVKDLLKMPLAADVVLCFYADISDLVQTDENTTAAIPITVQLADSLGLTVDDLVNLGSQHMAESYRVQSMASVMGCLLGVPEETEMNTPMYIIGSSSLTYGAAAIMDATVRAKLNECCPNGFYLVPSSVHELLCIPKDSADPIDLSNMVKEINHAGNVVRAEDILSDHIFTIEDNRLVTVI